MEFAKLTAFCGLDCFNCELHVGNEDTEVRKALDAQVPQLAGITCKGCRDQGKCVLSPGPCATHDCAQQKGVSFCFECQEFPCSRLNPTADQADKYPHNLKIFNLCRMQAIGIEAWAEEAKTIRARYFKGKFGIGDTPEIA